MSISKKALDGNVETFLLSVLTEAPNYGYGIVESLNSRAPHLVQFGEGTVYPILHRMEKKGLIESTWETGETGRRRKYYKPTSSGKTALTANLKEWQHLTQAFAAITTQPAT